MADLFDMNMGGSGWHITSHLIAIIALFVACFAITGYIAYKDDTIPAGAIKDGFQFDDESITAASLKSLGALTVNGSTALGDGPGDTVSKYGSVTTSQTQTIALPALAPVGNYATGAFVQPANTYISGFSMTTPVAISTGAGSGDALNYSIGNASGNGAFLATANLLGASSDTMTASTWNPLREGIITNGDGLVTANTGAFALTTAGAARQLAQQNVFVTLAPFANALVAPAVATTVSVTMQFTSIL